MEAKREKKSLAGFQAVAHGGIFNRRKWRDFRSSLIADQQQTEGIAKLTWNSRDVRGRWRDRDYLQSGRNWRRDDLGTSAAIGFPIAIAGALGYAVNGLQAQGVPLYTIGYIYLPALVGIVPASVITAPLGVSLAHSLPVQKLKRFFAVLLLLVGTRMLMSLLG